MTVSTHVLDATSGRPADGVQVSLSCLEASGADGWLPVAAGETGTDGRLRFEAATKPGVYRLTFRTGRYFAGLGVQTFYPEVTVTFSTSAPGGRRPPAPPDTSRHEAHYHVPLLLSPFGYCTYRGA